MKKEKIFMKRAGTRGYSPLARVMTLAVMLLAMAATAWAQEPTKYTVTFSANDNTVTVENVTLPHTFSASYNTANEEFDLILKELYGWSGNPNHLYPATAYDLEVSDGTKVVSTKPDSYTQCLTINNVFEGSVTVNGTYVVNGPEFEYTVAISISAPTKYTVAMAEGTADAANWTARAGSEGEFKALPLEGVDKDTKPVTVKYSGSRHVKSVKAVTKAAEPAASYVTGAVNANNLKVGDILKDVTSISGTGYFTLAQNRYKENGNKQPYGAGLEVGQIKTFSGYTITTTWDAVMTPIDDKGQDGNAWIVTGNDGNGPVVAGYTVTGN